jgi:DNA-directed RNA polymerase subunit beta'
LGNQITSTGELCLLDSSIATKPEVSLPFECRFHYQSTYSFTHNTCTPLLLGLRWPPEATFYPCLLCCSLLLSNCSNKTRTGPEAIAAALRTFSTEDVENMAKEGLATGRKTKRPQAVKLMRYAHGLRNNNIEPSDYLIKRVPVIPPKFRPFSVMGDSFLAGDANELYKDLFEVRDSFTGLQSALGPEAARKHGALVYDAAKALFGYGDPVLPKTKQRGVSGFLKKITGNQSKFGFFQRKMISKPVDSSARGVIGVDPELDMDQVGIPWEMGWKLYAPYIHRRLVRQGHSGAEAALAIRDRTDEAKRMMLLESKDRPVIYSRAPSWHKFNVIAGYPSFNDGESILINPLTTSGLAGDLICLHQAFFP